MKKIEKKCLPEYFDAVKARRKTFEIRRDDADYQEGDILELCEWDGGEYTGNRITREITYVLRDCPEYGLMPGYCVIAIQPIGWKNKKEREINMIKQVKFKELETNDIHGGILLDNGDLICGCCGGIFEADEKGETWELLKEYDNWVSLDDEIIGDDWEDEEDIITVKHVNIENDIQNALDKHKYLFSEYDGYQFYMEAPASYNDQLDNADIAKIIENEDPEEEFYDFLDNVWSGAVEDEYYSLESSIEKDLQKAGINADNLRDKIDEYVREKLTINPPYSYYKAQMVNVTIIMDTGDANYDYSINKPPFVEKSGLAWLASTQGYSLTDMNNAMDQDDNSIQSAFIRSVKTEIAECPSDIPAVTFLVKMSFGDLLELNRRIKGREQNGVIYDATKRPDCGTFHIGKETMTGLFDFVTGGGSLLEIKLEKDIDIPIKFIRSATPDVNNCQGIRWCVGDVYGMCGSAWKETAGQIRD